MKVLIWGDRTRYERDLPDFISSLPLELVYCPREQPLTAALPEHSDAQVLFVDAIAPVDRPLMDRLPETARTVVVKSYDKNGVGKKAILENIYITIPEVDCEVEDMQEVEDRRGALAVADPV